MTVRRQARPAHLADRASSKTAPSTTAPRAPRLGELLHDAREQKGVDLYRAERDTKIRVKYLEALERSDFTALPGAVYTKGFLRNYAIYLGLDPEAVLGQWKQEVGTTRLDATVVIPPRPLEAPRGGLTFTPGVVIAALLTFGVLAFAGYVAYQLLRFQQPPVLAVTSPAAAVSQIDAASTTLVGRSDPGATITITITGGQVFQQTAATDGSWSKVVPLAKGRNDFTIVATDPATSKDSAPQHVVITVPLPSPGPESPTLSVTSPTDGTAFQNGAIPVQGSTTASSVTVTAQYLGPTGASPSAQPSPRAPAMPAAKQIAVAADGSFSDSYRLAPGRWALTITATGLGDKTTTEQRTVSVAFTGVDLVIAVRNGSAWIKVWVDGQVVPGYLSGQTITAGKTLEFTGKTSVEVRTGNSGSTYFTLNGSSLGSLGGPGVPQTWLFQPPSPPQQTNDI